VVSELCAVVLIVSLEVRRARVHDHQHDWTVCRYLGVNPLSDLIASDRRRSRQEANIHIVRIDTHLIAQLYPAHPHVVRVLTGEEQHAALLDT